MSDSAVPQWVDWSDMAPAQATQAVGASPALALQSTSPARGPASVPGGNGPAPHPIRTLGHSPSRGVSEESLKPAGLSKKRPAGLSLTVLAIEPDAEPKPLTPVATPKGQRLFEFWQQKSKQQTASAATPIPASATDSASQVSLTHLSAASSSNPQQSQVSLPSDLTSADVRKQLPGDSTSPSTMQLGGQQPGDSSSPSTAGHMQAPAHAPPADDPAQLMPGEARVSSVPTQTESGPVQLPSEPGFVQSRAQPGSVQSQADPGSAQVQAQPGPVQSQAQLGFVQSGPDTDVKQPQTQQGPVQTGTASAALVAQLEAASQLVHHQSLQQAQLLEGLERALSELSEHCMLIQNPQASMLDAQQDHGNQGKMHFESLFVFALGMPLDHSTSLTVVILATQPVICAMYITRCLVQ